MPLEKGQEWKKWMKRSSKSIQRIEKRPKYTSITLSDSDFFSCTQILPYHTTLSEFNNQTFAIRFCSPSNVQMSWSLFVTLLNIKDPYHKYFFPYPKNRLHHFFYRAIWMPTISGIWKGKSEKLNTFAMLVVKEYNSLSLHKFAFYLFFLIPLESMDQIFILQTHRGTFATLLQHLSVKTSPSNILNVYI